MNVYILLKTLFVTQIVMLSPIQDYNNKTGSNTTTKYDSEFGPQVPTINWSYGQYKQANAIPESQEQANLEINEQILSHNSSNNETEISHETFYQSHSNLEVLNDYTTTDLSSSETELISISQYSTDISTPSIVTASPSHTNFVEFGLKHTPGYHMGMYHAIASQLYRWIYSFDAEYYWKCHSFDDIQRGEINTHGEKCIVCFYNSHLCDPEYVTGYARIDENYEVNIDVSGKLAVAMKCGQHYSPGADHCYKYSIS